MKRPEIAFLTQTKYHYDQDVQPSGNLWRLAHNLSATADLTIRNRGYETIPHYGAAELMDELEMAGYDVLLSDIYNDVPKTETVCISTMDINTDRVREIIANPKNSNKKFVIGGNGLTSHLKDSLVEFPNTVTVEGSGNGFICQAVGVEGAKSAAV